VVTAVVAVVVTRSLADSEHAEAEMPRDSIKTNTSGAGDLFEAILGTMFDGVMVADSARRLLYVNPSARALLELGDRRLEGRLVSEASRSAPLQELIDRAIATGTQQHTELVLSRQKLSLAVSAGPLELDRGRGVLIVMHDVTELRRLERMRREFVSNVSHELKTPLTSIQAYADTLLEGGLADLDNNRTFVERIVEQTERLRTLIMDLLHLARIESDDLALDIGPIDVAPIIDACVADRMRVASARSVTLAIDPLPRRIVVRAEAEGLRTILDNLIDNAINYTPPDGRITISCRQEGSEACLSVADTGVGIPRELQHRVFERFYRVDRARSRAVGGTGLGLAIVKHLAQAFGGRIELESELNVGSRFSVWLPLALRQPSEAAETP
jgi:two-component system phosphate regulon sensor histidine kinase PhoR